MLRFFVDDTSEDSNAGIRLKEEENILRQLSGPETIRRIYADIHEVSIFKQQRPSPRIINNKWAIFRWIQSYTLIGLQHICRHESRSDSISNTKFSHDLLDTRYLISASLINGIATKDSAQKKRFKIMCPDGLVIDA